MHRIIVKTNAAIVIGLAVLFVVGCGLSSRQKSAVVRFGAASADLATVASNEFIQSRKDVIEMNAMTAKLMDDRDYRGDGSFTTDSVKVRIEAMTALKDYGSMLSTLVSSDQTDQIKASSDSFVASVKKIDGVGLSDANGEAISTAVQAVGGILIEYMRQKALRKVIDKTHQHVIQLIDTIETSYDPEGDRWTLGYDQSSHNLKTGITAYTNLNDNAAGKALTADANELLVSKTQRADTMGQHILIACEKLRTAQHELRLSTLDDSISFEAIEAFVIQMQDIVALYEILSED